MQRLLIALFTVAVFSGCGTYKASVQVEDTAYLLIVGSRVGVEVVLDDLEPIILATETEGFSLEGRRATKIKIGTGSHVLKITRNGDLIYHKRFYVSSGNSYEVQI